MAEIRITDRMIEEFGQELGHNTFSKEELRETLLKAFYLVQRQNFPVRAYFESQIHAELIALFMTEDHYDWAAPSLKTMAQEYSMELTEGID